MASPPNQDPWYKLDRYSDELPKKINEVIDTSAGARKGELLDAALMAFFYERDRWSATDVNSALGPAALARYQQFVGDGRDNSIPAMNQVKSAIDTMVSQMIEGAPTLRVRTVNATYEVIRQHEIRSRVLNGTLANPSTSEAEFMWARDGLIKRKGWVYPRYSSGQLVVQRLQPYQVYYDPRDAMHGDISQLHVVELIERDEFLSWYEKVQSLNDKGSARQDIPDKAKRAKEIEELPRAHGYTDGDAAWQGAFSMLLASGPSFSLADRLRVVYSWRRSWRNSKPDGRALITVFGGSGAPGAGGRVGDRGVLALDVPFSRVQLPAIHWSPWRADLGIDGISMVDLLLPTQLAIDRSMYKLQRMQDKYGHHKLVLPPGTPDHVATALMNEGVKVIHSPAAQVPTLVEAHTLSQSQVAWLEFLISQPIAMTGVTQGALEGRSDLSPAASGISRIEDRLQKRDRQNTMREAYSRARIQLGHSILSANDDALGIDKDYQVSYTINTRLVSRPWADLQIANNAYVVDIEQRGTLGDTRSGQIQKLIEYANLGLLDPDIVRTALIKEPDVERWASAALAPVQAIEDHLAILSDPDAEEEWPSAQPTEDMDLQLAVKLTTLTINQAMALHAADDTVARLSAYKLAAIRTLPQPELPPVGAAVSAELPSDPSVV